MSTEVLQQYCSSIYRCTGMKWYNDMKDHYETMSALTILALGYEGPI